MICYNIFLSTVKNFIGTHSVLGVNTHKNQYLDRWIESDDEISLASSVGVCRGALGELFQGPAIGMKDEIAIVSSLISKHNKVYYSENCDTYPINSGDKDAVKQLSAHKKSFIALEIFCNLTKLPWPKGSWCFEGELPVARGMASSTADIIATLRCYANLMNINLTHKLITDVLKQVERSDSVFINQPVLFCSSQNSVIHYFNQVKPIYCLYMDDGSAEVHTEDTREILLEHYQVNYADYKALWHQTIKAFEDNDLKKICESSTLSAKLSQQVMPKKAFNTLSESMELFKADGLVVAHTGTIIGYLFCTKPSINLIESVSLLFKTLGSSCQLTEIG